MEKNNTNFKKLSFWRENSKKRIFATFGAIIQVREKMEKNSKNIEFLPRKFKLKIFRKQQKFIKLIFWRENSNNLWHKLSLILAQKFIKFIINFSFLRDMKLVSNYQNLLWWLKPDVQIEIQDIPRMKRFLIFVGHLVFLKQSGVEFLRFSSSCQLMFLLTRREIETSNI